MPWSAGVYTRTDGVRNGSTVCAQEQNAGLSNTAPLCDAREQDLATGINNCIAKDGSNKAGANLPMNGFKHTGAAQGATTGDYMEFTQANEAFQPLDATLTAFSGLTIAANEIALGTGTDTFSMISFTAFAQTLAALANAGAVKGAIELEQAVTASGSSLSIDLSLGWNVKLTLSANVTSIAFTNAPTSGTLLRVVLEIASTGSFTMGGWPSTIWTGGNAPTITSGSGKKDTIILTSNDGLTSTRGYIVSQNMS